MGKGKRKGFIRSVAGLGARSVDDLAIGTGDFVGKLPVLGGPSRRAFNLAGRLGSDTIGFAGERTADAAGLLTFPFRKLFGRKTRSRTRRKGRSIKRKGRSIKRKGRSIKRKGRSIKRKGRSIKRKGRSNKRKGRFTKRKGRFTKRKGRSIRRKCRSNKRKGRSNKRKGRSNKRKGRSNKRKGSKR